MINQEKERCSNIKIAYDWESSDSRGPWDLLLLAVFVYLVFWFRFFMSDETVKKKKKTKKTMSIKNFRGLVLRCSSLIVARRLIKRKGFVDLLLSSHALRMCHHHSLSYYWHILSVEPTRKKKLLIITSGKLVDYIFFFSPSSVRSVGAHWEGRTNFALCRTKFWFHFINVRTISRI